MAPSKTNSKCASCGKARNCVNGRYCTHMKKYVEYSTIPPCIESLILNQ